MIGQELNMENIFGNFFLLITFSKKNILIIRFFSKKLNKLLFCRNFEQNVEVYSRMIHPFVTMIWIGEQKNSDNIFGIQV